MKSKPIKVAFILFRQKNQTQWLVLVGSRNRFKL